MDNECEISTRARATMEGLKLGDMIGGPSSMAAIVQESLLENKGFNRDDLSSRYVHWLKNEGFDTGPVAWYALELQAKGVSISKSVKKAHKAHHKHTAGCNPAHRAIPIALSAYISDQDLKAVANAEASITHYDPLAGAVSYVVLQLVRQLLQGASWKHALEVIEIPDKLRCKMKALTTPPTDRRGYAPAVLHASLYFMNQHDTLTGALKASLDFSGEANYTPVIVGALANLREVTIS